MLDAQGLPKIKTDFAPDHPFSFEIVRKILLKAFPRHFFENESLPKLKKKLRKHIPLCIISTPKNIPGNVSFICIFPYRSNAFKFFIEMVTRWLVPGKRLDLVTLFAADFRLPEIEEDEVYTLCEAVLHLHHEDELESLQKHWPLIENEVCLGLGSAYYARRIQEVKGLSSDEKTAMVHEYIANLLLRRPYFVDSDIITEMQHFMVISRDEFKEERQSRHLSRLIAIQYVFRRRLLSLVKNSPQKRHLLFKLFKSKVHFPSGEKQILGIVVGLNFLKDKEVFEQRHLMKAIQALLPHTQAIEQSFLSNKRGSEHVNTFYLEIEKIDGTPFNNQELEILRKKLPKDLKNHVEQLLSPVFMPRNEEEIMRNIVSLSNQIKYTRDIPQVFISFDEQTSTNLFFTIIMVRVLKEGSQSIQELFKLGDSYLHYIHDRAKIVGSLRKKYLKEASVFRVKFNKDMFLRGDHSIDLYKARQAVVNELSRLVGPIRDYNGGMIAKQNELLTEVRTHLQEGLTKHSEYLLENFFYSLAPVIMRTVLEPEALKSLYLLLLEGLEKGLPASQRFSLRILPTSEFVYVMLIANDRQLLDDLARALNKFQHNSYDIAQAYVKVYDSYCMGYVYRTGEPNKQEQFCQLVETTAESWLNVKSRND